MRTSLKSLALVGALALTGALGTGTTGAATPTAAFTGTVGEIVDPAAETGIPRRWLRHVGDPAPAGYSHGYQWGAPSITTPAGGGPITIEGTLDVTDAVGGDFGLIGLSDTATLATGERGLNEGVYLYVSMSSADTLVLGLSDGRGAGGGEYVQRFHTIDLAGTDRTFSVTFTVDPDADPAGCASDAADVASAEGCLTLDVAGLPTLTDSYGSITNAAANGGEELRDGGTAGWDGLASATVDTGIDFDLTISPVVQLAPQTKDDCKRGGWEGFGFSNQGRCIASVVSGRP